MATSSNRLNQNSLPAAIASFTPQPGQFAVACVDYDGLVLAGNDSTGAIGFGTTMAAALAAAKLTPFKTYDRLGQVLPRSGSNAIFVAMGKPRTSGATYKKMDGTTDQTGDWKTLTSGWSRFICRPTGDFSNSNADKITLGFQIVSGTNALGYNPTAGATTTSVPCQLAGGGAAALPAEAGGFSSISGKRIRFDANTATTALRNACANITKNTTTTITTGLALPATPGLTDVFYIEETALQFGSGSCQLMDSGSQTIVGERYTATTSIISNTPAGINLIGCEVNGNFTFSGNVIQIGSVYVDEGVQLSTVGPGLRVTGTWLTQNASRIAFSQVAHLGSAGMALLNVARIVVNFGVGSLLVSGVTDTASASNSGTSASGSVAVGDRLLGAQGGIRPRVSGATSQTAAVLVNSTGARISGWDISNQTKPMIQLNGNLLQSASVDDIVSTDGGNTDVVLDVSGCKEALVTIALSTAITATATVGDLRMASSVIAPFSNLATCNYVDAACNNVIGSGGSVLTGNTMTLSNQSGGALAFGAVVRSNGTTGQMTSAQADTAAHAKAVLGVCISAPASGSAGLVVPAGACPVLFAGAPGISNQAYVNTGTAGQAQDSAPAVSGTNQKVRLGPVISTLTGNLGLVRLNPDNIAVTADGNA